jgi:hypothetical protein
MTISRDFQNPASPAERITQLHNDRLRQGDHPPSSLFREATKSRTLSGGSYEAERDLVVAGESAATLYPRLPESSPWSGAGPQPGIEPPLGASLSSMIPADEATDSTNPSIKPATALAAVGGNPLAAPTGPLRLVPESTPSSALSAAGGAGDDPGAAIPPDAGARLGELLDRGLVRPVVRRRKV